MNNKFINTIVVIIAFYIVYLLYIDYKFYLDNKDNFILTSVDFEEHMDKYHNSDLYRKYNNLSYEDKEFIHDLINYTRIKHRETKPRFHKKMNSIKENVILAAFTANLGALSTLGFMKAFQRNIFHHFSTLVI